MLELARKLSDCDAKYFGGWLIAGVEVKLKGEAEYLENGVILSKARRCVHEARGFNANGELVQSLRLFLVLPTGGSKDSMVDAESAQQLGEAIYSHRFSVEEIENYLSFTGDENIIHKGLRPLVPGICMLHGLKQHLGLRYLEWKVSFLAPVYAGEELNVHPVDKGFEGYVKKRRVFVVKI